MPPFNTYTNAARFIDRSTYVPGAEEMVRQSQQPVPFTAPARENMTTLRAPSVGSDIARIKRNVKRMVDLGAPEQDIDQYLATEGVTPEQLRGNLDPAQLPPRNPPMSFMEGLRGVGKEMLGGIPVAGPALVGLGDRVTAGARSLMGGDSYGQELEDLRTQQENFAREHPNIARSAGTAGAAIGVGLLGRGLPGPMGVTGRNIFTRSLASAGSGAVLGGADALARGEDPAAGAAVGTAFGAVAPAAGQMVGAGVRRAMAGRRPPLPTLDAMKTVRSNAYRAVDNLGARYTERAYDDLVVGMKNEAKKFRLNVMRHPKAVSMLQDLEEAKSTWENPGSPTLTELDQLRQIIRRDVVEAGDDAEAAFGDIMMDRIDDLINSATPAQMAAGTPGAAAFAIQAARRANTQMRKAEMIEDALVRARRRAESTGSGGNVENTIRQNFRAILDNPSRVRAFTKEERAIMEKIVAPSSKLQDIVRLIGKLSPSGNGLMAALSLGATAMNPAFALPAGAGIIAKRVSEGMTQGRVNKLEQLVKRGSVATPPPSLTADALRRISQSLALGAPLANYPSLLDSSALQPR